MDQYHDNCHTELLKIARDLSLPEYAKEKDLDETELKKLSSLEFAFPEARYFPIHTKEDAIISSAFFLTKKAEFGKYQNSIYDRLRSACKSYNILEDFDNLEGFEKQASTKEYLLPELKKFPVNTKEEMIKAGSWLVKQQDTLGPELYQNMKQDLAKRYDAISNEHLGPVLDLEKAASLMIARAKKTQDPILKQAMLKFTKAMMVTQSHMKDDDRMIEKLAEFIDRYDNVTGVNKRGSYGRGREVFTDLKTTKKNYDNYYLLKQASATVTLDGKTYTSQDLEKVSADQLRNALGDSFVNAISDNGTLVLSKFAEIADTLPLPDKKILAMYLS
tara:strand:- start:1026 stop:2021 length:996 start_codon:yes stop_codon:yes gene_type:complete